MKRMYTCEHVSRYEAGGDGFVGISESWEGAKRVMDRDWYYLTARERKLYSDKYAITEYSVTDDEFYRVLSDPTEAYVLNEQGLMVKQEICHMNQIKEDK